MDQGCQSEKTGGCHHACSFSVFPNYLCQICCSFLVPLHQVGTALWLLVEARLLPAFIPVFSSIVPLELVQHMHVIGSCNKFVDH